MLASLTLPTVPKQRKNFFDSDKLYNYLSSNNITDFQSFEFTFEYFSLVLGKKILYEYLKNLPESNDNQVYLSNVKSKFIMEKI